MIWYVGVMLQVWFDVGQYFLVGEVVCFGIVLLWVIGVLYWFDIVYCDIKIDNIYFGQDGILCVFDFGVVISFGECKVDELIGYVGMLFYMVLELFENGEL